MTDITSRDLRESLTLLFPQKQEDGEGGWRDGWKTGPRVWASLFPLMGGDGFHANLPGDPMIAQKGYLKGLPPARYRLIIRAGIDLPQKIAFLWHLYQGSKRLIVINSPVLIQYNRFLRMIVVEDKDA